MLERKRRMARRRDGAMARWWGRPNSGCPQQRGRGRDGETVIWRDVGSGQTPVAHERSETSRSLESDMARTTEPAGSGCQRRAMTGPNIELSR